MRNNLKDLDVTVPLSKLIVITGVSGSGKSTLMIEVLYKKLAQTVYGAKERPGLHDGIDGLEHVGQGDH